MFFEDHNDTCKVIFNSSNQRGWFALIFEAGVLPDGTYVHEFENVLRTVGIASNYEFRVSSFVESPLLVSPTVSDDSSILFTDDWILDWRNFKASDDWGNATWDGNRVVFESRVLNGSGFVGVDPSLSVKSNATYYNVTWEGSDGHLRRMLFGRTSGDWGPHALYFDINDDGDFADSGEGNQLDLTAPGKELSDGSAFTCYSQMLSGYYYYLGDPDCDNVAIETVTLERNGSVQAVINYDIDGRSDTTGLNYRSTWLADYDFVITSGVDEVLIRWWWDDSIDPHDYLHFALDGEETLMDGYAAENTTNSYHKGTSGYGSDDFYWTGVYDNSTELGIAIYTPNANDELAATDGWYGVTFYSSYWEADQLRGYGDDALSIPRDTNIYYTLGLYNATNPWTKMESQWDVIADFDDDDITIAGGASVTEVMANGAYAIFNATGEDDNNFNISISSVDHTHDNFTIIIYTDDTIQSVTVSGGSSIDQGEQIDVEATPGDTISFTLASFNSALSDVEIDWLEVSNHPVYDSIAEYYDDRTMCSVASVDDYMDQKIENATWIANNFTDYEVFLSGGIITNATNSTTWTTIQGFVNDGFFEASCHSRNHENIPYSNYTNEIIAAKDDIIGNLTLSSLYRDGAGNEFVWAWIEPYGESDATQRGMCGDDYFLADRDITLDDDWVNWDSTNELYHRAGFSQRVKDLWSGEDDIDVLNAKFDSVFTAGGVYHLFTHPSVNTTALYGHLDHISGNKSVWFAGVGASYMYHYVQERGITTTSTHGDLGVDRWFNITVSSTNHDNYGLTYPVTYIFNLNDTWTSGYKAQIRHNTSESWSDLTTNTSSDFFNGIECVRFDYTNHKAYVSVAFDAWNDEVHIRFQLESDYSFVPSINPGGETTIAWEIDSGDHSTWVTPRSQTAGTAIIKIDWTDRPADAELEMKFTDFLPTDYKIQADPDGTFGDGDTVEWLHTDEDTYKEILPIGATDPEYIWLRVYVAGEDAGDYFTVTFNSREAN
jgi:hypothetical protein